MSESRSSVADRIKVTDFQRGALKHSFRMSTGSLGAFVFIFIQGLITPHVLKPVDYGTLGVFSLVIAYAGYAQLGMKNAQNLLVPGFLRKGDEAESQRVTDAVFTSELLLTTLVITALWVLYVAGFRLGNSLTLKFVIIISGMIFFDRANMMVDSYLFTHGQFSWLARHQLLTTASNLLFCVSLLLLYGVIGLLVGTMITDVLVLSFILSRQPIHFRLRWDWRRTKECVKIGFPIHVNNWVGSYLWVLEKTIIAVMLSRTDLAMYGFGLIVFTPSNLIPNSFNKIISRRMAEHRGLYGTLKFDYMQRFFDFPLSGYLFLSTIIVGAAFFFYQALVRSLYPQYLPSIVVFELLIFGYPFYQLRIFAGSTLNVINQSKSFLLCQVLTLGINAGLDYTLIKAGYGINGAAAGSSISYVLMGFFLLYAAYLRISPTNSMRIALSIYARIFVCWCACYGLMVGLNLIDQVWMSDFAGRARLAGLMLSAIFKSVVFAVGSAAIYGIAFRKDDFLARVKKLTFESGTMIRQRMSLSLSRIAL